MKFRVNILLGCLLFSLTTAQNADEFKNYFENKTMRIDYFHTGDADQELITIDFIYQQGSWAGNKENLLDNFNLGRYYQKVYDVNSNALIYSKGFDSYFGEYKTSTPALNGEKRTYHESALIPFPKHTIKFVIERRNRQNILEPILEKVIDPKDISILKEKPSGGVNVFKIVNNGSPQSKVDVAIVAEGYTETQEYDFENHLKKFTEVFFSLEPYKSHRDKFNIYGVFKPSLESGVDEPRHASFKNTSLSATFNSLDSERYLLTEDNKSLRDIAAHVPYDALVIMVNHERYGGGGIYNFFCTFTAKNQWSEYLLLHEFGHSFVGLADEYYTSSTAYNEFYPRDREPNEPNITALLHPADIKWKDLLTPGIEIPTPWGKEKFDMMDEEYQKIRQKLNEEIAQLKRDRASAGKIRNAEDEEARLSRNHAKKMDEYLYQNQQVGKIGVFEGAGYSSEGLYRPMLDCIMFSKGAKPFCKVCEKAIERMIEYHTK